MSEKEDRLTEQEQEEILTSIIEGITEQAHEEQEAEQIAEAIVGAIPEEKQEELFSDIQKLVQQDITDEPIRQQLVGKKDEQKWREKIVRAIQKKNARNGSAIGITRKDKSPSKKAHKTSKNSRRRNRGK
jgi:hypothetical protein